MKEKAIVVDIDGVLLDVSLLYKEIENLGLKGQDKWNFFHENANNYFKELYDHIKYTFNTDELKSRQMNSIRQIGQQLINKFGAEHQIIIAIEELSEFYRKEKNESIGSL